MTLQGPEGMQAVRTLGTGSLSRVRVIHLAATNLYWFEVDSSKQQQSLHASREESELSATTDPTLPAWALSSKPLFPMELLGLKESATNKGVGKSTDRQCIESSETSETMERLSKKAKFWQQRY